MANQKHPDPHLHDRHHDGDFDAKHWTDGFPQDFHGWGPQTPIPDDESLENSGRVELAVDDGLVWQAGREGDDHIIWRYEGMRH